jgi:hypothetical protein
MHQGSLRLDLRGNIPQHQYEGRLSNVDVHALLMQNTTLGPVLQGRLNSTCVLIGEGIDYNSIIQKIKGNGIYELREGRLNTFSLGARLSLLTQLTGWNLGSKTTELQEADGSFQIDGPRIILDKSRVRTPEALVITDGSVGLDKTLNLKATAELSEQWKVSGNIVGQAIAGIAATFFRNEEGKVIVPFYLRGTIDNPIFALDSKTVQAGVGQVLKPENIQSGIKSVGDFIQQASKMKSASPETTLPAAPTPPLAPGATTTTTLPSKTGTLIEGIGNLVGGILGAVQQGAKPPTQPPPDIPPEIVLVPNVTHLISEIQVLTAMPALSEEVKQARLRAVINTIFAVPSPR